MIVKNMSEEEEKELLKQLAKEIAKSKNKWHIIKEIDDMIDFGYDWIHFESVLSEYRIFNTENYPKYSKISKKLENRELLLMFKKYILEFIFNKS